ncbi:signal peptidase II [Mesorhizobium xinjiangense]|uniref:signal peptidase II n=1 Tax=Mesorhizobium xinjiangense TaxID=2678685 RepID=UPI0012ED84AC|nr:signal peptidase II [Mesorhizobium xinjiangense]
MRLYIYLLIVLAGIGLDQWIKHLVEAGMAMHQQIDLLPFLALYRVHNYGIAFSMFSGSGDFTLIVVTTAVILLVLWLAWRSGAEQLLARIGFALVVAGALGNLIDRVRLGYVVDYVLFHTPVWSFAVFNLADALISIGAALVIIQEFLGWRAERSSRSDG